MRLLSLKNKLNWTVAKYILTHISPNIIPMSGRDRLRARNYYTLRITFKESEDNFVLRTKYVEGATGYFFVDGGSSGSEASLPKSAFDDAVMEISHYFRAYKISYNGLWGFVLGKTTLRHYRVWISDRIGQFFFNQKTLKRTERLTILSEVVDRVLADPAYTPSSFQYMEEKFGHRWSEHPEGQKTRRHIELLFESLEESGDLKKVHQRMTVSGKAISTLAEAEVEDRRHIESVRQQRLLALLTFGLVAVGFVQILLAP
jgi:hypothetical protein